MVSKAPRMIAASTGSMADRRRARRGRGRGGVSIVRDRDARCMRRGYNELPEVTSRKSWFPNLLARRDMVARNVSESGIFDASPIFWLDNTGFWPGSARQSEGGLSYLGSPERAPAHTGGLTHARAPPPRHPRARHPAAALRLEPRPGRAREMPALDREGIREVRPVEDEDARQVRGRQGSGARGRELRLPCRLDDRAPHRAGAGEAPAAPQC